MVCRAGKLSFVSCSLFFIKIVLFFYDSRCVSVECYVVVFCSSEKKLEFVAGAMFCGKQG